MRATALHPVIFTGIVINVSLLAAAMVLTLAPESNKLSLFLTEDGLIEWLQFLCFVALALLLAFVAHERWSRSPGLSLDVVGIAGLSALVALAALEEISWFQRVLNIGTPEFFRTYNRQGEANLHNLDVGGASLHKAVLLKLIFVVGIAHNLVLPLLARRFTRLRGWVENLGLYLPPLSAAAAYLLLVLLSQLLIDHPRRGEMGEVFGAVHYLSTVFAAYVTGIAYDRSAVFDSAEDRGRVSILFAMFMLFLVFVAWLLGVGYLTRAGSQP